MGGYPIDTGFYVSGDNLYSVEKAWKEIAADEKASRRLMVLSFSIEIEALGSICTLYTLRTPTFFKNNLIQLRTSRSGSFRSDGPFFSMPRP